LSDVGTCFPFIIAMAGRGLAVSQAPQHTKTAVTCTCWPAHVHVGVRASCNLFSSLLVHRGLCLVEHTLASQRPLRTRPVCLTRSEPACYRDARAEVAQLAEHSPEKAGVDSSILSLGTIPSS